MITQTPHYTGIYGKAWKVDIAALKAKHGNDPAIVSTSRWILLCPGAHPLWSWYLLSVVTLDDKEGLPPADKQHPDNTHEVTVFALHPDHEVDDLLGNLNPMLGPNVLIQAKSTDAIMDALMREAAKDCVLGKLSPDSDFARMWKQRFNPLLAQAEDMAAVVQ